MRIFKKKNRTFGNEKKIMKTRFFFSRRHAVPGAVFRRGKAPCLVWVSFVSQANPGPRRSSDRHSAAGVESLSHSFRRSVGRKSEGFYVRVRKGEILRERKIAHCVVQSLGRVALASLPLFPKRSLSRASRAALRSGACSTWPRCSPRRRPTAR